jgi:hypothetical protein
MRKESSVGEALAGPPLKTLVILASFCHGSTTNGRNNELLQSPNGALEWNCAALGNKVTNLTRAATG